jgi:hypothetical protein
MNTPHLEERITRIEEAVDYIKKKLDEMDFFTTKTDIALLKLQMKQISTIGSIVGTAIVGAIVAMWFSR